jgi:hypothetical protein
MVLKTEINPSRHYKKDIIEALTKFRLWFKYNNNFKDVTRDDVISFLDIFRIKIKLHVSNISHAILDCKPSKWERVYLEVLKNNSHFIFFSEK